MTHLNRTTITDLARRAGMRAYPGYVVKGKRYPAVNALGSSVPVEWLEKFADEVIREHLVDPVRRQGKMRRLAALSRRRAS